MSRSEELVTTPAHTHLTHFSVRAQSSESPNYTAALLGSELIHVFLREVRFVLAVCPQLSVVYLELDLLPAVLTAGVITNYTTAGRPAVKKATRPPKTSEMQLFTKSFCCFSLSP